MKRQSWVNAGLGVLALVVSLQNAGALSIERWTDAKPYGTFFNDYDPNFYTGFVPRVQNADRVKIHLARGNQLRVRIVLSDESIDNYLPNQAAKHALFKEVIDKGVITLTSNTSWEDYSRRFEEEGLAELAQQRESMSPGEWRDLNAATIAKLNPERMYRIQKDFDQLASAWAELLRNAEDPKDLGSKLDLINPLFPHRLFVYEITDAQDVELARLMGLAKAGDDAGFRTGAEAFFHDLTKGIYNIEDGKLDYYEITAIYPAGTYDTTTKYRGHDIPQITTPGVWFFQPREHGTGDVGMVDYISKAGYYGLIPMFPYEYAGGSAYNSIHNTGISNWIPGHPLLPAEWRNYSAGSRNGKAYNRVALTSRGPVSHGCTRLNSGHLVELREMLPSVSAQMEGVVNYRNVSYCYDVFDRRGDGDVEVMGVQYYFAFRHTNERVAKQIWAQNNRRDFYEWLYGDEMKYGPVGDVTFPEVCEGRFVKRKAVEGPRYRDLKLYEAPYQPETVQFYKIKGVESRSSEGFAFNRELRRVGHGYEINRAQLHLD